MADSNFSGGPLQSAYPFAPTPPMLRHHDQDTLAPSYPGYGHFSPYDGQVHHNNTGQFHHHNPGPYRLPLPDPYGVPHAYGQNRFNHFPMHPPRAGFYSPPNGMFQNRPDGAAASGMAPSHLNGVHMASSPHPDFLGQRNASNLLMLDPPLQSPMHGYSSPSASHWYHSQSQQVHRGSPTVPISGATPQTPPRYGGDAMRANGEGRAPARRTDPANGSSPRHMASPPRRPTFDRHNYLDTQEPGTIEPRAAVLLVPPTRRVDRSVSPRTSNRRSFDRYSTDLSQSSNAPENPDAALNPGHRARRPRTMGFGGSYRARMFSHDPNVPTASQMQHLKDKLRHFLPNELPEDASAACDICQKDYSAKHVLPTEEEEVAIQLPCKHVFGEHCINTWFETCKTHKNKLTCPMCRKLLIEPHKSGPEMMRLLQSVRSADRHVFERLLGSEELRGEERQLLENVVARELEGDFAHP